MNHSNRIATGGRSALEARWTCHRILQDSVRRSTPRPKDAGRIGSFPPGCEPMMALRRNRGSRDVCYDSSDSFNRIDARAIPFDARRRYILWIYGRGDGVSTVAKLSDVVAGVAIEGRGWERMRNEE